MPTTLESTQHVQTAIHAGPVSVVALPDDPGVGAEAVFIGRTRAEMHPVHGELQHLDYHAYPAMAEVELRRLGERVLTEHGLAGVRIVHAVGAVAVGEASVVVQCWAGHRDAAFAACRDAIDSLKAAVPIWKREVWADGTTFQDGVPVAVSVSGSGSETTPAEGHA